MTQVRENAGSENCSGTSLADILQSALPPDTSSNNISSTSDINSESNTLSNSICNSTSLLIHTSENNKVSSYK